METTSGDNLSTSQSVKGKGSKEIAEERHVGEYLKLAFEKIIDTIADTDKVALASTSIFIVYAHDNDSTFEQAESKLVQSLIHLLQRLRSRTISDRSPLFRDSWTIREDGKAAAHNILSNQFCLLPKRNKANDFLISSIDKVILCSSTVLQCYRQDARMKKYTEVIKECYDKSEKTLQRGNQKAIDDFKEEINKIVTSFSGSDGYHHVITEMAFLEIRAKKEDPKYPSIIPVILNGETNIPPFDKLDIWIAPSKTSDEWISHESQILHKLFFRLLQRLFEDLQPVIEQFEECYNNCVELLLSDSETIVSSDQEFENKVLKEVSKTLRKVNRDLLASTRTTPNTKHTATSYTKLENHEIECLKSLAFPEMNQRENQTDDAATNTCLWFLEHETYRTWINQDRGLLQIRGKPGSGKSTLMKYALESALNERARLGAANKFVIASFFFHGRGVDLQKNCLGLYRSLLYQILDQVPDLLLEFSSKFKKERETKMKPGEEWKWEEKDLRNHLKDCIAHASRTHSIQFYVDALDEGDEKSTEDLVKFFKRLASLESNPDATIGICFSCRPYPVILAAHEVPTINVESYNEPAIKVYVQTELKHVFDELEQQKAQELQDMIIRRADNVFQWLVLVVPRISSLYATGSTAQDLHKLLQQFPTELGSLYQGILRRIDIKHLSQSLQLMQWICFALRPLSLGELRHAMAIHTDLPDQAFRVSNFVETDNQMEKKVKSLCGGLAEIRKQEVNNESKLGSESDTEDDGGNIGEDKDKLVVQFIHQSVKDYLQESGLEELETSAWAAGFEWEIPSFWMLAKLFWRFVYKTSWINSVAGRAHFRLSRACLRYLGMENRPKVDQPGLEKDFPLFTYAAKSWISHAKLVEAEGISQKDLLSYLYGPSNRTLSTWIDYHQNRDPVYYKTVPLNTTLLHIAAKHDLLSVQIALMKLESGFCANIIDQKDSEGLTPLCYAARNGHEASVKLLLATNQVEVNSKDMWNNTPLTYAIYNLHEGVVKLLLATGQVEINPKDKWAEAPLFNAAKNGKEAVIKLLLALDQVKADSKNEQGQTPLMYAAENGHETIIKLLLATGQVEVNSKDNVGQTALFYAACSRHEAVVKLLLATGQVEVNSKDNIGQTALFYAARKGREAVVKLLLATGQVEVDPKDKEGRTPLFYAARNGKEAVVKLLLALDQVKADSGDKSGQTPLMYAAEDGHEAVVKLLLALDQVKADSKNKHGQTPLMFAAYKGRQAVIKLLFEKGAEVNTKDHWGWTPLFYAIEKGYTDIVRLLLEKGAEINTKARKNQTPLLLATKRRRTAIVQLLLEKGAEVNTKDERGRTPLSLATEWGHTAIIQLLLDNGAGRHNY